MFLVFNKEKIQTYIVSVLTVAVLITIANVGKVYTRSQILEYLRGDDGFDISERAVDVQILNIRRKLNKLSTDLETLRGVGYRLKEPNNE